jgi:hypothetical protein
MSVGCQIWNSVTLHRCTKLAFQLARNKKWLISGLFIMYRYRKNPNFLHALTRETFIFCNLLLTLFSAFLQQIAIGGVCRLCYTRNTKVGVTFTSLFFAASLIDKEQCSKRNVSIAIRRWKILSQKLLRRVNVRLIGSQFFRTTCTRTSAIWFVR